MYIGVLGVYMYIVYVTNIYVDLRNKLIYYQIIDCRERSKEIW
jgi:hypothetical protein